MEPQTATVSSDGQLVLPAEVQSILGIPPGSLVEIQIEDDRIKISLYEEKKPSPEQAKAIIEELRSMFSSGPSLEDEYFRDREKDRW